MTRLYSFFHKELSEWRTNVETGSCHENHIAMVDLEVQYLVCGDGVSLVPGSPPGIQPYIDDPASCQAWLPSARAQPGARVRITVADPHDKQTVVSWARSDIFLFKLHAIELKLLITFGCYCASLYIQSTCLCK